MRVCECMSRNVCMVPGKTTVLQAATTMKQADVGFLPVVDEHQRVVGVVTDRDLIVKAIADGGSLAMTLATVMTGPAVSIDQNAQVEDAIALLRERGIGRLVVIDEEQRVTGIFSLADAAAAIGDRVIGNVVIDAVSRHSHAPSITPPAVI